MQPKARSSFLRFAVPVLLLAWGIHYYHSIPAELFGQPCSCLLYDRSGELRAVRLASDEQWRFPASDSLPSRFRIALLEFEDRHFYRHPGVNPFSLMRAAWQNLRADRILSGGSTISMQVIRLHRRAPTGSLYEKFWQIYLAFRIELSYSKDEILRLYADNAPFGGNVVGIRAASWRYFNRPLVDLSWAESAVLAVLPNNPSWIYPGRNDPRLLERRNRLLAKLMQSGRIDSLSYRLALEEPLPDQLYSYPSENQHLLSRLCEPHKGGSYRTTIDSRLQERSSDILQHFIEDYSGNKIHNAAALILDVNSNEVLAYVGNTGPVMGRIHENSVDMIRAERSPGSLLKPLLYTALIDEGQICPDALLPDIPTIIQGFAPRNFDKRFAGAVPASKALSRSLNVPAVNMLRMYRYERFHPLLRRIGFSTFRQSAGHYGLSIILGGAESTLWELAAVYAGMSRQLQQNADTAVFLIPALLQSDSRTRLLGANRSPFSRAALWHTATALKEVERPDEQGQWREFSSSQPIAWKTGTSYGFRDAWAIGFTADHCVAVWVGNASGEGRPGLVGVQKAAPLMFALFEQLPRSDWFNRPEAGMQTYPICNSSGHIAGPDCASVSERMLASSCGRSESCPHCRTIWVNESGEQVHRQCATGSQMESRKIFSLPAVQEYYYRRHQLDYESLPAWSASCAAFNWARPFDMVYPTNGSRVIIPKEMDGKRGAMVCELSHRMASKTVHWHLGSEYLGSTRDIHQMACSPEAGKRELLLMDEDGYELRIGFEVISPD